MQGLPESRNVTLTAGVSTPRMRGSIINYANAAELTINLKFKVLEYGYLIQYVDI